MEDNLLHQGGVVLGDYKKPKYLLRIADNVQLHTYKSPNWFNRLMQRLCFGFRWEPLEKRKRKFVFFED